MNSNNSIHKYDECTCGLQTDIIRLLKHFFGNIDISSESYLGFINNTFRITEKMLTLFFSNLLFEKKELVYENSIFLQILNNFNPSIELIKDTLIKVGINELNIEMNEKKINFIIKKIGGSINISNRTSFFDSYIKHTTRLTMLMIGNSLANKIKKKHVKTCICGERVKKACIVCKHLYCGKKCQKNDWEIHKLICVELKYL